jgi:hypothetical protein
VHAFCNVFNGDGSCFGRDTLTRATFASFPGPPSSGSASVTCRLAPSILEVCAEVDALNTGLNPRLEQSAAWNGLETVTGTWSAGIA